MNHSISVGVIVCLLAIAGPLHGAVTLFTDAASWNAAAAPGASAIYLEDFQGFAADTSFQTSPVAGSFFTLEQEGSGEFRNTIDVPPLSFTDNNGTSHASLFTNYGVTTVEMSFDSPVFAWGADFFDAGSNEMVDLDLVGPGGGTLATVQVPDEDTFFGFVITGPVQSVEEIVFKSRTDIPGMGGEGFGMDNVRGAAADAAGLFGAFNAGENTVRDRGRVAGKIPLGPPL